MARRKGFKLGWSLAAAVLIMGSTVLSTFAQTDPAAEAKRKQAADAAAQANAKSDPTQPAPTATPTPGEAKAAANTPVAAPPPVITAPEAKQEVKAVEKDTKKNVEAAYSLEQSILKIQADYKAANEAADKRAKEGADIEETAKAKAKARDEFTDKMKELKPKVDKALKDLEGSKTDRAKVQKQIDDFAQNEKDFAAQSDAAKNKIDKTMSLDAIDLQVQAAKSSLALAGQAKASADKLAPDAAHLDEVMKAYQTQYTEQNAAQTALQTQIDAAEKDRAELAAKAVTASNEATKLHADAAVAQGAAQTISIQGYVHSMENQAFDTQLLLSNWKTVSANFKMDKDMAEAHYAAALDSTLLGRYVDKKIAAVKAACGCGKSVAGGLGPDTATDTSKGALPNGTPAILGAPADKQRVDLPK